MLRGLVRPGDGDELLTTAYDNLSLDDWKHAYWTVFRSWSDVEDVPDDFVRRLVNLWEWRVSELELSEEPRTIEEAQGLGWLFRTPHIPDDDRLRLGQATARLARGQIELHGVWGDLLTLAESRPDEVLEIIETVLKVQLREDFPYVPTEEVKPVLAVLLRVGGPHLRDRVRHLINRLGKGGFRQFKELLDERSE